MEEGDPPTGDAQAIAALESSNAVEASYGADGITNDSKKALAAFLAKSDGDQWNEDDIPAKALQFMTYTVSIEDTCRRYWVRSPPTPFLKDQTPFYAHARNLKRFKLPEGGDPKEIALMDKNEYEIAEIKEMATK